MPLTTDTLTTEITTAFDGIPREDGITLHEAEEIDCHGSPEELLRARQRDTDSRWQDIPDQWISELPSAVHFLDAKGLRYYLPAIMLWHFRHPHWSEPATADLLYSGLTSKEFPHHHLVDLYNSLTDPQRRAVAHWLHFYGDDCNNPNEQLTLLRASCWGKYLDE
jgi:hypothetical protein